MSADSGQTRRSVLRAAACGAGVLGLSGAPGIAVAAKPKESPKEKQEEEEITANEDLMREHGVLRRAFGVYDELHRRLEARKAVPLDALAQNARLIHRFIEQYHELIEEQYVFPVLEKAAKLAELTAILRTQHQRGRVLTERILHAAEGKSLSDQARREVSESIREFLRMYRPHAAREDTIVFPAFHEQLGQREYDKLGDVFEEQEKKMVGEDAFEKYVDQVTALEKQLGIADLNEFTPKA